MANAKILCVGSTPITGTFPAVIKLAFLFSFPIFFPHLSNSSEDVRATEVDKVEIDKCFRPGDVVRAEVVRPL